MLKNVTCIYHQRNPSLGQSARKQLEIGQGNESYWTNDHFLHNIKDTMKIAALKHHSATHNIVLLLTRAAITVPFGEDSLDVKKMNMQPGSKQQ